MLVIKLIDEIPVNFEDTNTASVIIWLDTTIAYYSDDSDGDTQCVNHIVWIGSVKFDSNVPAI